MLPAILFSLVLEKTYLNIYLTHLSLSIVIKKKKKLFYVIVKELIYLAKKFSANKALIF